MKYINSVLSLLILILISLNVNALSWQQATDLLTPRAEHTSIAYRSSVSGKTFLYVIHGNPQAEAGKDGRVFRGEIGPDGNIIQWIEDLPNLNPFGRAHHASVIYEASPNDVYIYIIGGNGCPNKVHYAKILDHETGELDDWVLSNYHLDGTSGIQNCNNNLGVSGGGAILVNNVIYLIGGTDMSIAAPVNTVRYNTIGPNGEFTGNWQLTTPITTDGTDQITRSKFATQVVDIGGTDYVYIFGGTVTNLIPRSNTVYRKEVSKMQSSCPVGGGCWIKNNNNLPANMRTLASFSSILSYGGVMCNNGKYVYIIYANKVYGTCFNIQDPIWQEVPPGEFIPDGVSRYKHSSASLNEVKYIIGGVSQDGGSPMGMPSVYYIMPEITGVLLNMNPNSVAFGQSIPVRAEVCINNGAFPDCLTNGNKAPDGTILYFNLLNEQFPNMGSLDLSTGVTVNGVAQVIFTANNNVGTLDVRARAGTQEAVGTINVFDPSGCAITAAAIKHPDPGNGFTYEDGSTLNAGLPVRFEITAAGAACANKQVIFKIYDVNDDNGVKMEDLGALVMLPVQITLNGAETRFTQWLTEFHDPVDPLEELEDGDMDIEYMFTAEVQGIPSSVLDSSNWIQVEDINRPFCGNGILNLPEEECDGGEFGGEDCQSLGFPSGILSCFSYGYPEQCTFDTSSCSLCGNGVVDPGETCDTALLSSCPGSTCANDCSSCGTIQPGLAVYITRTECEDDGNGDNVGRLKETKVTINLGSNFVVDSEETPKECTLIREVQVPFFNNFNLIIFVILLVFYYIINSDIKKK